MTPEAVATAPAATAATQAFRAQQERALFDASRALWVATLSLMSAFMNTQAPAHRLLLARRIARNFTLLQQQECFAQKTRDSFTRLARRWEDLARKCNPEELQGGAGWLRRVKLAFFSR